jgi:hypothetical protein
MTDSGWLVFAYTLPPEPSRLRVSVWRRLKRLGAVYLPEGFWVLPHTDQLVGEVERTIEEVKQYQGSVSAFRSVDFTPEQTERLSTIVVEARNEEYAELQGQCARFRHHVEHATTTGRFTFAEVEELEEEIGKIDKWLREIKARDVLGSSEYEVSIGVLGGCRVLLQEFIDRAFERIGDSPPAPETASPS